MTAFEVVVIVAAGFAAGTINAVVGSGTLITFPTLLAFGYPPVTANVTNTVGLFPGSFSGVVGFRRELAGQRDRVRRLVPPQAIGGLVGGLLLLTLPAAAFDAIVPALILLACVLVVIQPALTRRLAGRRRHAHGGPLLMASVFLTGVYGGYFGAAQGVILIALLAVMIDDELNRLNGLKNLLAGTANLVAAALFALTAPIDWGVAALLALGSIAGGQVGAVVGRRIPAPLLRAVIVVIGLVAAINLLRG
jgi:uncharacterized membrane protein YfcA